jgi:hypothetical protein
MGERQNRHRDDGPLVVGVVIGLCLGIVFSSAILVAVIWLVLT